MENDDKTYPSLSRSWCIAARRIAITLMKYNQKEKKKTKFYDEDEYEKKKYALHGKQRKWIENWFQHF